jgi:hypothetical protein
MTYDTKRIPSITETSDNITKPEGFKKTTTLAMRLTTGALLWLAPVRASWVFTNAVQCKGLNQQLLRGRLFLPPVATCNAMALAIVFLVWLAASREVRAAFENPRGCHVFHAPPVKVLMLALGMLSVVAPCCAYSTAPYGRRYKKAFKFVATGAWIQGCAAKCK